MQGRQYQLIPPKKIRINLNNKIRLSEENHIYINNFLYTTKRQKIYLEYTHTRYYYTTRMTDTLTYAIRLIQLLTKKHRKKS